MILSCVKALYLILPKQSVLKDKQQSRERLYIVPLSVDLNLSKK